MDKEQALIALQKAVEKKKRKNELAKKMRERRGEELKEKNKEYARIHREKKKRELEIHREEMIQALRAGKPMKEDLNEVLNDIHRTSYIKVGQDPIRIPEFERDILSYAM